MNRKRQKFVEHGGQARVLAFVAWKVVYPIILAILTLGTCVMAPISLMAKSQAGSVVFNAGYSPAAMTTSNLPQSRVIYYDSNFVANLKAKTPALRCANRRELPERSGNQHQLFLYNPLTANTAQAAEGTVGSPITVSVQSTTPTIGNYADYINMSTLSMQTAIDPALENIQKELAYRLGLTLNKLTLNTADGASVIDAAVNGNDHAANVPFGKADITTMSTSLGGANVATFEREHYCGLIHNFMIGDTYNDASNNSLTDVLKHTAEGQGRLEELPDGEEWITWAGVKFYPTTTVTQTANYKGSGKTALRTYVFGEDALIAISLGRKEQIGNGDYRNLKLYMNKWDGPEKSDPAHMIGGSTAYNVNFVVTLPPDTKMRMRTTDAVAVVS